MAPTPMSMMTQKPHDHSHPVFSAKSSKVSKTLKVKSSKSKSAKSTKSAKSSKSKGSKGSKSDGHDGSDSEDIIGKTGKDAGDYMLYDNTGKVTGFSVEKAESSSSSSLYCSTLGLVMTLMTSYLFAR
eukprot:CAMPEP_0201646438 /NCGR_PEP_ID=MMETSP0493-20130528/33936_1 /ASSEMBLY_ACC=CAM_ASM_000838 /TAXON_ID=420259 /ORGANISM="Thalassiosira gravida, Strain GMp14c1" /LENGTH=127 /DNA_ID=CAMNT_0048121597 /DNA_START=56 /DNA_END=439 /DNA_ORIENTATION=+